MGGGGYYVTIGFSPQLNQNGFYTVYLGGDTLGLFRSEDNGQSWIARNEGLYNWRVSDIAFDPSNPRVVFLATDGGLYKSLNGGDRWIPINYGRAFSIEMRNNALCAVAVDPTNGSTVFIGTGYKDGATTVASEIYRSTAGGETGSWQQVYSGLYGKDSLIHDIAVNPQRPHSIYAALGPSRGSPKGGMLLHSADGGDSWSVVEQIHGFYKLEFSQAGELYLTGWDQSVQSDLCWYYASRSSPRAIYVGKIVDDHDQVSGRDIVPITPPASGRPESTCGLCVAPDGTVYVGDMRKNNPAVWKYSGGRWTGMDTYDRHNPGWNDFTEYGNPRNEAFLLGLSPDGAVWHGGSMALFRWTDNEWRERYSYPRGSGRYSTRGNANTLSFSPELIFYSASEYYWGLGDLQICGTQDGGASAFRVRWPEPAATQDSSFNDARVFTADRQNNNVWYVVTHLQDGKYHHGALLRKKALPLDTAPDVLWETILTSCMPSAEDARSCPFSPADLPDAGGISTVLADGNTILVATYEGGVYRTTQAGVAGSWVRVASLENCTVFEFAQSALEPNLVLAAAGGLAGAPAGNGVWRSLDTGETWTRIWAFSDSEPSCAVTWAGGATWYVGKNESVYRTTDHGETWTPVYSWTPRPDPVVPENRYPIVNKISVALKDAHDPAGNPVCAAFTIDGWFDHPSTGGVACSLRGGGAANSWRQLPLHGISHQAKGIQFNPYDWDELFYLSGGSGVYKARLTPSFRRRKPY